MSVGLDANEENPHTTGHNLIKAHAYVYKLYKEEFKEQQKGLAYLQYTTIIITINKLTKNLIFRIGSFKYIILI